MSDTEKCPKCPKCPKCGELHWVVTETTEDGKFDVVASVGDMLTRRACGILTREVCRLVGYQLVERLCLEVQLANSSRDRDKITVLEMKGRRLSAELAKVRKERGDAEAIVDLLPKDAEGVPRLPGDELWYPKDVHGKWCDPCLGVVTWDDYRERYSVSLTLPGPDSGLATDCGRHVEECYFTEDAARAAKEGNQC